MYTQANTLRTQILNTLLQKKLLGKKLLGARRQLTPYGNLGQVQTSHHLEALEGSSNAERQKERGRE